MRPTQTKMAVETSSGMGSIVATSHDMKTVVTFITPTRSTRYARHHTATLRSTEHQFHARSRRSMASTSLVVSNARSDGMSTCSTSHAVA